MSAAMHASAARDMFLGRLMAPGDQAARAREILAEGLDAE